MPDMAEEGIAFTIIQIGNAELDEVYHKAIRPGIEDCDLVARRVDKHTKGGLLKSEIVQFLSEARIVVADLTNERPNCYLEIGYCMGLGRFNNLVLTVRQDHTSTHESYSPNGPRVHFDLQGYDILPWDPADLPGFRAALSAKIRRRLSIGERPPAPATSASRAGTSWVQTVAAGARQEVGRRGFSWFMEIEYWPVSRKHRWDQEALLRAAREAQVPGSGWPIGMVREPPDPGAPRPRKGGIQAEIVGGSPTRAFDSWAIDASGYFYQLDSPIEALTEAEEVHFDTRIRRTTEALVHARRLYRALGLGDDDDVCVRIGHHGLFNKPMGAADAGRYLSTERRSSEDRVIQDIEAHLRNLNGESLAHQVEQLLSPMFMVFQFMRVDPSVYGKIVERFRTSHPGA